MVVVLCPLGGCGCLKCRMIKANSAFHVPFDDGELQLLHAYHDWKGGVECGYTGQFWSAEELIGFSMKFARALSGMGLQERHHVGILLGNTIAYPVTLMAVLSLGCVPVLMHAATPQKELAKLTNTLGLDWVCHDHLSGLSRLSHEGWRTQESLSIRNVVLSVRNSSRDSCRKRNMDVPAGSILHATSGTYGGANYCVRTQRSNYAEAANYLDRVTLYRKCRVVLTTPMSHAYGFGFGLMSSVLSHSVLCIDHEFNPKRIVRILQHRDTDILAIVPPMVAALVECAARGILMSAPRATFYAGAPCTKAQSEMWRQHVGALYAIYGTTETGAISTTFPNQNATGVGTPLRNVAVRTERCQEYGALGNGVGPIFVRSPSMMHGYYDSAVTCDEHTYWPTGDIGRIDEAGRISLLGRNRDVINVGGMKVNPDEVEEALKLHPGVHDVAVYRGRTQDDHELVQAAVVLADHHLTEREIREYCHEQLNAYKTPVRYWFVPSITRTPSGKCMRSGLPGYSD
jgi:long-chain acyl-CoA synthetase